MKEMTGDEWELSARRRGGMTGRDTETDGGRFRLCPYHGLGSELTVGLGIYSIYTTTSLQNISILGVRKQTQEW